MKKTAASILTAIMVFASGASAEMDHQHNHKQRQMEHSSDGMAMSQPMKMHSIDVDGYKLDFHIMDQKAFRKYMDNMGHTSHKMREGMSHYVMVDISDKDGGKIKRSKMKLKIISPGNKESEKVAFPMMGSFGSEFDMTEKGEYQIMTLFKINDEKHKGGFRHEMK
ncbi:MAG: hypothetical protein RQ824_00920 [bacterium]|nr:hypothetical protein [bacterium]